MGYCMLFLRDRYCEIRFGFADTCAFGLLHFSILLMFVGAEWCRDSKSRVLHSIWGNSFSTGLGTLKREKVFCEFWIPAPDWRQDSPPF